VEQLRISTAKMFTLKTVFHCNFYIWSWHRCTWRLYHYWIYFHKEIHWYFSM